MTRTLAIDSLLLANPSSLGNSFPNFYLGMHLPSQLCWLSNNIVIATPAPSPQHPHNASMPPGATR